MKFRAKVPSRSAQTKAGSALPQKRQLYHVRASRSSASSSSGIGEDAARRPCCFYGWLVWLVLCVGSIGTFFGTSSAITFVLDDIMAELDLTRSAISAVYMAGTLLGAAVQIPIGRAVDRFGGRRSIAS